MFRGTIAILNRVLREDHSEKIIYELKLGGAEGNLPWGYVANEDSRKENSNYEGPEVAECLANSSHIKGASVTRAQ